MIRETRGRLLGGLGGSRVGESGRDLPTGAILPLHLLVPTSSSATRMAFLACCVSTDGMVMLGTDSEETETAGKMKEKTLPEVRQLVGQLSITIFSRNGRASTGCLRRKTSTTTG